MIDGEHWTAFVPYAAHWPYEVHLYPKSRVPDLLALGEEARAEFPGIYLELLRRFDRLFGAGEPRTPTSPPGTRRPSYATSGPGAPRGRSSRCIWSFSPSDVLQAS